MGRFELLSPIQNDKPAFSNCCLSYICPKNCGVGILIVQVLSVAADRLLLHYYNNFRTPKQGVHDFVASSHLIKVECTI